MFIKVDNLTKSFKLFKRTAGLKGAVKSFFKREYEFFTALDNINLALVTKDEHPNHFAIVDHSLVNNKKIKYHRDGIGYIYQKDPNGNYIELIDRESK